ncbi:response regulator [Marinospirillum alkaliphilum]|uniref:PilZ domain-containing protein n=1 Tax=Marinospirillum alkaliphilum DSM 21637 TaxID=1122209 RepID=A0A1K1ZH91_9GAMM|nr:response regulator [Marinospirillum alkaliphilum]SFX73471.1 PilZ domain-containing protein [Marinospirillum alkaliphilum DSM 21637]
MLDKDVALVVDDSATARTAITNVLRDRLFCKEVIEAHDGQEALRLLKQRPDVDWIFCDWEMPVMSGDQVLAAVRENPETSHLPFIMITSKGDRDSLVTAVQLGVTSFVVKPFTAKKLVEKVFLARGRMERRNAERVRAAKGQKVALKLSSGGELIEADLVDVSLSGMLMLADHDALRQVTVFDAVQIRIEMPGSGTHTVMPCQVIRLEADPLHPSRTEQIRVATRFQPMDGETRRKLVEYIELTSRRAASTTRSEAVD